MARNGSGTYSLPLSAVVADTTILASWANTTMDDIATALTNSLAKNGETNPTANLPMNGFHHTGVSDASGLAQYPSAQQVVDGALHKLTSVGGTADAITAVGPLSVAAYVAGQRFSFVAAATNTGAVTININSIGAKSITRHGTVALEAGDIFIGAVILIEYDGTQFQIMSILPINKYISAVGVSFQSGDEIVMAGVLPSGWTIQAASADHAIRLNATMPSAGTRAGTVNFTTAFASQAVATASGNVGDTTLTAAQSGRPGHTPTGTINTRRNGTTGSAGASVLESNNVAGTAATMAVNMNAVAAANAASSHTHTFTGVAINLAVKYHTMCVIQKT